jgi:hypothetical protein
MRLNPCLCRRGRLWCWLDWLSGCHSALVCNRHEEAITRW